MGGDISIGTNTVPPVQLTDADIEDYYKSENPNNTQGATSSTPSSIVSTQVVGGDVSTGTNTVPPPAQLSESDRNYYKLESYNKDFRIGAEAYQTMQKNREYFNLVTQSNGNSAELLHLLNGDINKISEANDGYYKYKNAFERFKNLDDQVQKNVISAATDKNVAGNTDQGYAPASNPKGLIVDVAKQGEEVEEPAPQPAPQPEVSDETFSEIENENNGEIDSQPNSASNEQQFPLVSESANYIYAVPPAMSDKKESSDDGSLDEDGLYTLLENNFPIITIAPVEIKKPENSNIVSQIDKIGPEYKFMLFDVKGGNVSYSISNEFASSMIESGFRNIVESELSSDLWQMSKNNMNLNTLVNGVKDLVGQNIVNTTDNIMNQVKGAFSNMKMAADNTVAEPLMNLTHAAVQALLFGQKIDIPNIWKGSSSQTTQTVNIRLHCLQPENDEAYKWRILNPLLILLKLALPYSKGGGNTSGGNDIITYENPPYLDVKIDGIFRSKLCGISNMTVNMPYEKQSLVKGGRPSTIDVSITFTDMYEVIVWSDTEAGSSDSIAEEKLYSITGQSIVKGLKDSKRDSLVNEIDRKFEWSWVPQSSSDEDEIADDLLNPILSSGGGMNENLAAWFKDSVDGWERVAQNIINDNLMQFDQNIAVSLGSQIDVTFDQMWAESANIVSDNRNRYFSDIGTSLAQKILNKNQLQTIIKQPIEHFTLGNNNELGGFSF